MVKALITENYQMIPERLYSKEKIEVELVNMQWGQDNDVYHRDLVKGNT